MSQQLNQQPSGQPQESQQASLNSRNSQPRQHRRYRTLSTQQKVLLIVALIGAAGVIIAPIIGGVFLLITTNKNNWQTPTPTPIISPTPIPPVSVTITSPSAEGIKVPRQVMVQGTASNIPQNESLWIVVQPVGTSKYFPQPGPVEISSNGNTWSWGVYVGRLKDSGKFVLWAVLADRDGRAAIEANLRTNNNLTPGSDFEPLEPLPKGIQMITSVIVVRI